MYQGNMGRMHILEVTQSRGQNSKQQRVEHALNMPVVQTECKKGIPPKSGYSRHILTKLTISLERVYQQIICLPK